MQMSAAKHAFVLAAVLALMACASGGGPFQTYSKNDTDPITRADVVALTACDELPATISCECVINKATELAPNKPGFTLLVEGQSRPQPGMLRDSKIVSAIVDARKQCGPATSGQK